jgi:predicted metal-dependent HD superfamily phosphohydrolase
MDDVVKSAAEFVTRLLNENLPSEYKYHNLMHAREVFEAVTELGKNSNLSEEELEIIQIAAWFHDTGFVKGNLDHENNSIKILKEFLGNISYPEGKINRISDIIIMTEMGAMPNNLSERIIRDADILHVGKEEFFSKSLTLKSEWENIDHKKFTDLEWLQASLDFINRTLFFTDYANSKYETGRQKNISSLKEMIEKLNPS